MRDGEPEDMGRVTVEAGITNYIDALDAEAGRLPREKVRAARTQGVVDTGATLMVLPQSMADTLGLIPSGEAVVRYADHRSATRPVVEAVRVEILGRKGVFQAILEPARDTVLVGAMVLEGLDLLVDCPRQTLRPRDPEHIIAEVE